MKKSLTKLYRDSILKKSLAVTFLVLVIGISVATWHWYHPPAFRLDGTRSWRLMDKNWFENNSKDPDRPEDESEGGDEILDKKRKEYLYRAYPAQTIPAGSRAKAWAQFQKLYPTGQTKSWKPVNDGTNGR